MNFAISSPSDSLSWNYRFSPGGLDRLDVSAPYSSWGEVASRPLDLPDWNYVHSLIQQIFSRMVAGVQTRWPMIGARGGRTSARSFYLFSYMTFSLADADSLESVIVGLNFDPTPSGGRVRVRGDIGGEESGRIDFELEERSVHLIPTEVIPLALDMASRLADQAELVARAVLDRHPVPEY